MKKFSITKPQLAKSETIEISTIDKEDLRIAEISFSTTIHKFCIWFNGKLIHTCRTIGSINTRLSKLNEKFPLEY